MPRMSEAEKRKSHDRILDAAAAMFRDQGIAPTSLSDVMKAAGMTHGGFYRHFSGKDDLVAAAFDRAVDAVVSDMESAATDAARQDARAAYVDAYLSMAHVHNRKNGCPMAALGAELAQGEGMARDITSAAVERVAALLSDDGETGRDYARLALLVGSITLARLVTSDAQAEAILTAARDGMKALP